jgi:hypothetical protein
MLSSKGVRTEGTEKFSPFKLRLLAAAGKNGRESPLCDPSGLHGEKSRDDRRQEEERRTFAN